MAADRKLLDDPVALRLALWVAVAVFFTSMTWWWRIALLPEHVVGILAGKFSLVGLAAAVATFQYTGWHAIARETLNQVYNPEWMARQQQFDLLQEQVASNAAPARFEHLDLEIRLSRWHEWRLSAVTTILSGILPYNQSLLTDLVSGLYLLLLSSIADLAGLAQPQEQIYISRAGATV